MVHLCGGILSPPVFPPTSVIMPNSIIMPNLPAHGIEGPAVFQRPVELSELVLSLVSMSAGSCVGGC